MHNFPLKKIADYLNQKTKHKTLIQGVSVDSRLVQEGDLFVCLEGARVDGHEYVKQAEEKGAAALLVHKEVESKLPQIKVNDTLESMSIAARLYRQDLNARFISITGSNGKTSTKDMLHAILSQDGKTHATHSNQNTEIGTYLNLFQMDFEDKWGIFELGLDQVGDVSFMADILQADAAIVTSLAPAHMMNFKDIEHIADEKLKIFDVIKDEDFMFYQGDFIMYREKMNGKGHDFGFDEKREYHVSDVTLYEDKTTFKLNGKPYTTNLLGRHQASNAAAVIALCQKLGIEESMIQEGLNHVALTGLRTEKIHYKNADILLDSYKSNESSLRYALELFDNFETNGKRYLVLSEMVEIGAESQAVHQSVMKTIDSYDFDGLYTLGEEFIKVKSDEYKIPHHAYLDFDTFKTDVEALFLEDAFILIKGSRSYALERLINKE